METWSQQESTGVNEPMAREVLTPKGMSVARNNGQ